MYKIVRKIILLIIIFLAIAFALRAEVFEHPVNVKEVAKELPSPNTHTCTFVQERFLKESEIVLTSGGNFKFDKEEGVFFETLYPVKTTSSFTKSSNKKVLRIVNAIAKNDFSFIEKNFDCYFEKQQSSWTLGLIPKSSSQISEGLKSLKLSGTTYIKTIEIKTQNGDDLKLNFTCNKG